MQNKKNILNSDQEWPSDGIEFVPSCPVCGEIKREIIYEGLTDNIFFCAPGKWNMYCCNSCKSAYLNPRPSKETIGLAYQTYYTHDKPSEYSSLSFLDKLRRRLANGDRNHRYGTQDSPASIIGVLASFLIPSVRKDIDAAMRHLPRITDGERLLDLGCGNGNFLLKARSAGWDVVGVDFDAKAVKAALHQGLDVRMGGVEILEPSVEQFDVITLSHIIEHVHNPIKILQMCYSLLKPGGYLWLETPNIGSEGHRLFAESWRGLETPRHLVIFNFAAMHDALGKVGFCKVETQPYRLLCKSIFNASQAISDGFDPYLTPQRNVPSSLVREIEKIAKRNPSRREFIAIKAWKK